VGGRRVPMRRPSARRWRTRLRTCWLRCCCSPTRMASTSMRRWSASGFSIWDAVADAVLSNGAEYREDGMRFLLLCGALLAAAPALANDTSAVLTTGGLEFITNQDIVMESEELFISKDEIRVVYQFRND